MPRYAMRKQSQRRRRQRASKHGCKMDVGSKYVAALKVFYEERNALDTFVRPQGYTSAFW